MCDLIPRLKNIVVTMEDVMAIDWFFKQIKNYPRGIIKSFFQEAIFLHSKGQITDEKW